MLTWAERLILWNQYEILKKLEPEEAVRCEERQEILADGYEQFYTELNLAIDKKSVKSEETEEVIDILDMFRAITSACKKHKYKPKSSTATFEGFDANNDHPQYGIAHFLRRTQGKWEELKDASFGIYRWMLKKWKKLGDTRYDLTPEQIEKIAAQ